MQTRAEQTDNTASALEWAQRAITYTKKKISLGSVNKQSDQINPDYYQVSSRLNMMRKHKKELMAKLMYALTFNPASKADPVLMKINARAYVYEKYKVGNCKEQTAVALAFLKRSGFDDVDICEMKGGDHAFLLLNGCIICDPWADKIYHVKDFAAEREAAKSFRYADVVYTEMPDVKSYLFGIPIVKRCTAKNPSPSIVRGQFVRSGIENLSIDYSEFVQTAQAELDRMHGAGVKIFSLEEFFMAHLPVSKDLSPRNDDGKPCHDDALKKK